VFRRRGRVTAHSSDGVAALLLAPKGFVSVKSPRVTGERKRRRLIDRADRMLRLSRRLRKQAYDLLEMLHFPETTLRFDSSDARGRPA